MIVKAYLTQILNESGFVVTYTFVSGGFNREAYYCHNTQRELISIFVDNNHRIYVYAFRNRVVLSLKDPLFRERFTNFLKTRS